MDFEIIKNAVDTEYVNAKYPFKDMEVDDAFDLPSSKVKKIRKAAWLYSGTHGGSFSVRKINNTTHRCLRLS